MSNTCCNRINFCSTDKNVLARFHSTIEDGDCYHSLFIKNGYSDEEARELVDGRDAITYCNGEISTRDSFHYFSMDTETAWSPHMDCLHILLEEKYNNEISMYYISEEPGCSVYVTNDSDNIFFNDLYVLDCWDMGDNDGKTYFSTKQELVSYINERMGTTVNITESISKMQDKIKEANPESYCYINRFEFE